MEINNSIQLLACLVTPEWGFFKVGHQRIIPVEHFDQIFIDRYAFIDTNLVQIIPKNGYDHPIRILTDNLCRRLNKPQDLTDAENKDLTIVLDYISRLLENATYLDNGSIQPKNNRDPLKLVQDNILTPLANMTAKAKRRIKALLDPILEKRLGELKAQQTRLSQTIEGFKHNVKMAFSLAT